ncbi:testis-specific serine/threonine-protein kinase 3-like [Ylistrum balloti]|uniref:testis-specific serine/threonine-protein kinase 3-like n=1 Tax=Ylistrum balloti TaxID=509963 RepID=UPI0029058ED0|nr:testis-specific serine/threonine-protein kinase 3-like [Ylistrum balloti]
MAMADENCYGPTAENDDAILLAELDKLKNEVERVKPGSKLLGQTEEGTRKLTYRAVLAQRGFLVKKTLGSGSYSTVKLAFSLHRQEKRVAVKVLSQKVAPKDYLLRFLPKEKTVWPRLDHPHVIKIYEMFEDTSRTYFIMEYAARGDLLRYVQRYGPLHEVLARHWFDQSCKAVEYLHSQAIAHRDLKLENILLDSNYSVKIGDLGFVKDNLGPNHLSKTFCGSKSYVAPEILKGRPYDPRKSDVWALGAVLFIMVTGTMPFDEARGNKAMLAEHKRLEFSWKGATEKCRELILYLFTYLFEERPSISEVKNQPWMTITDAELEEIAPKPKRKKDSVEPPVETSG